MSPFSKFDDVINFRNTLNEETDRGVALMAASYLDSELKELLENYFVKDKKHSNKLFEFNGPCGSFSAKIDMSYALGLIGKKGHRDLHLIRKIRNEFGHVATPLKFDDGPIKERCEHLYYDGFDFKVTPRQKFTRVATGVLAVIHAANLQMKRCKQAKDLELTDETKEKYRKSLDDFGQIFARYHNEVVKQLKKKNA